ncbi:unnamed protein product [Linum trigynum]|uniref:Uncharacterized protein n=1 Tax=Linum trigynum TaxID=586398 RepID=A0AAV2CXN6_9ROSI
MRRSQQEQEDGEELLRDGEDGERGEELLQHTRTADGNDGQRGQGVCYRREMTRGSDGDDDAETGNNDPDWEAMPKGEAQPGTSSGKRWQ